MLKIGEFSSLTKITVKALRYYDKLGILSPALTDRFTSYRYYTEDQLERAQIIQSLRGAGLPCRDIRELLDGSTDSSTLLLRHRAALCAQRQEIDKQLAVLERLVNPKKRQTYTPVIEDIGEYTVYSGRSFIQDSEHIIDFIRYTLGELKMTNPDVGFPNPDYCCVIYPSDGFREKNICIEYVQSVDRVGVDTPIIKFGRLEAISAVSVSHKGDYDSLRDAYLAAVAYAADNGFEICGSPRERYLKGSWNCDRVEDWETVVQIPVKPI